MRRFLVPSIMPSYRPVPQFEASFRISATIRRTCFRR
jgi:hypothetical protein